MYQLFYKWNFFFLFLFYHFFSFIGFSTMNNMSSFHEVIDLAKLIVNQQRKELNFNTENIENPYKSMSFLRLCFFLKRALDNSQEYQNRLFNLERKKVFLLQMVANFFLPEASYIYRNEKQETPGRNNDWQESYTYSQQNFSEILQNNSTMASTGINYAQKLSGVINAWFDLQYETMQITHMEFSIYNQILSLINDYQQTLLMIFNLAMKIELQIKILNVCLKNTNYLGQKSVIRNFSKINKYINKLMENIKSLINIRENLAIYDITMSNDLMLFDDNNSINFMKKYSISKIRNRKKRGMNNFLTKQMQKQMQELRKKQFSDILKDILNIVNTSPLMTEYRYNNDSKKYEKSSTTSSIAISSNNVISFFTNMVINKKEYDHNFLTIQNSFRRLQQMYKNSIGEYDNEKKKLHSLMNMQNLRNQYAEAVENRYKSGIDNEIEYYNAERQTKSNFIKQLQTKLRLRKNKIMILILEGKINIYNLNSKKK